MDASAACAVRTVAAVLLTLAISGCSEESADTQTSEAEETIDYCAEVSAETLAKLHDNELFPTATGNGCFWAETPGGIAYLDFSIGEYRREPREYFDAELPSHIELVEVTDLGDGGLMTLADGDIGVVVIRKGDKILQSAATFLDIEPGSERHQVLWDIYRRALDH